MDVCRLEDHRDVSLRSRMPQNKKDQWHESEAGVSPPWQANWSCRLMPMMMATSQEDSIKLGLTDWLLLFSVFVLSVCPPYWMMPPVLRVSFYSPHIVLLAYNSQKHPKGIAQCILVDNWDQLVEAFSEIRSSTESLNVVASWLQVHAVIIALTHL